MGYILLVEDDYALALGAGYALKAEGYEVIHAGNLAEAKAAMAQEIDLILLDVMLPDGNGYDFCNEIRKSNQQVPIIFLTAVGEEVNIVQGLELGADDYITKPYRVRELLSRIAANLRRAGKNSGSVYRFGSHEFFINDYRLICKGKLCDLSPSELKLLKELVVNNGQVLTRNQLLERVFDGSGTFVDDNTLSVYMKRLRQKLEDDADYIETVRGIGYTFRKL